MRDMNYAVSGKDMAAIDKNTIEYGVDNNSLMELASNGVYQFIEKTYKDVNNILIVVGGGNNGGDGICLARRLLTSNKKVKMYICNSSKKSDLFTSQLNTLLKIYGDEIIEQRMLREINEKEFDLIIDAVFGNGLNRKLNDYYQSIIKRMNEFKADKLAIDIASGLDSETGLAHGIVFKADHTVTFHAAKIGMLINEGVDNSGHIEVVDIGLIDDIKLKSKINVINRSTYYYYMNKLKIRAINTHKYSYGVVGISIINDSMIGAGILAAKAAYRAGCGLVKIFVKKDYISAVISNIPEAVCHVYDNENMIDEFEKFRKTCGILVLGPGMGTDSLAVDLVRYSLNTDSFYLYDASALRVISNMLDIFSQRKCTCIITPHVGEMAGLISSDSKYVLNNIVEVAENFAEKYEVDLVVKSSKSVIITDDKYLSTLGNNGLAVAGSGDVLSGIIASLLAQNNGVNYSVIAGVAEHAMSSERFAIDREKRSMIASDIVDYIFVK